MIHTICINVCNCSYCIFNLFIKADRNPINQMKSIIIITLVLFILIIFLVLIVWAVAIVENGMRNQFCLLSKIFGIVLIVFLLLLLLIKIQNSSNLSKYKIFGRIWNTIQLENGDGFFFVAKMNKNVGNYG